VASKRTGRASWRTSLGEPRFWCLLYEAWLRPCAGDPFREGEDYFLSTREASVQDLLDVLGRIPVRDGRFPAVSVPVTLADGWRAGVDVMMCPEDFDFEYVTAPPRSRRHHVVGTHGGNFWLAALR
jgi:hypothetical protein